MADTVDTGIRRRLPFEIGGLLASPLDVLQRWGKKGGLSVALIVVLAAALVASIAVRYVGILLYIEQFAQDVRTTLYMPSEPQDPNIVIVTIDEGLLSRFPYSSPIDRQFLSELIRKISAAGARALALDVLFDQETEPEKDAELRNTLRGLKIPFIVSYVDNPDIVRDERKEFLDEFVPPEARALANLGNDRFDT